MAAVFSGLLIFTTVVIFLASAVGFILYLLRAIGVYKMATGLRIDHSWFAFVPVANSYIYGKVADEASGGGNCRKLLLGLKCVPFAVFVLQIFALIPMISLLPGALEIIREASSAARPDDMSAVIDQLNIYFSTGSAAAALGLLTLLNMVTGLANFVYGISFVYVSNKLFTAYGSSNALLISIIGFFFEIVYDIYIFMIRNNTPERFRVQE